MNVPIDGKMMPVVAHGGKNGYLYVLNAVNGAYLPHFKFKTITTYDPTGRGKKLNGLSNTQTIPNFGAAGCVSVQEFTLAAIQSCAAVPGNVPVDGSGSMNGDKALSTGTASYAPSDYFQITYGGTAPKPGQPGSYGPNVQGQNQSDPCPTCKLVNLANNRPIEGTSFAAAHTSEAYFAFGGTASGPFNYPFKSYSPITHNLYMCTRVSATSGKGNAGSITTGTESTNAASVGHSAVDPRVFTVSLDAVNMTNNTFAWRYGSKVNTYGTCNNGVFSTAGNLVFQPFSGRTDLSATQLLAQGIAPGGVFIAFDATTGKKLWQWGSPGAGFAKNGITYMYKGKQYVAIYHTVPAPTTYPGGLGSLASNQREQITVFTL